MLYHFQTTKNLNGKISHKPVLYFDKCMCYMNLFGQIGHIGESGHYTDSHRHCLCIAFVLLFGMCIDYSYLLLLLIAHTSRFDHCMYTHKLYFRKLPDHYSGMYTYYNYPPWKPSDRRSKLGHCNCSHKLYSHKPFAH